MRFFRFSLVLALLLPLALQAQRRRDPARGSSGGNVRRFQPVELRTKDLESLNPAKIALERRKDLELTTDQAKRLDSAAEAYEGEAKEFGRGVDTLQNIMRDAERSLGNNPVVNGTNVRRNRPESAKDSVSRARNDSIDQAKADRDQERHRAARNALTTSLLKIREAYDARLSSISALLTEDQRRKIGPWFDAASEELTARLHEANAAAGRSQ